MPSTSVPDEWLDAKGVVLVCEPCGNLFWAHPAVLDSPVAAMCPECNGELALASGPDVVTMREYLGEIARHGATAVTVIPVDIGER